MGGMDIVVRKVNKEFYILKSLGIPGKVKHALLGLCSTPIISIVSESMQTANGQNIRYRSVTGQTAEYLTDHGGHDAQILPWVHHTIILNHYTAGHQFCF